MMRMVSSLFSSMKRFALNAARIVRLKICGFSLISLSAANNPDDGTPISGGPEIALRPICCSMRSCGGDTDTACTTLESTACAERRLAHCDGLHETRIQPLHPQQLSANDMIPAVDRRDTKFFA